MRSIFWIGCILAVLVSLLSAGAFAESASPSSVEAAVVQAGNVTDAVKQVANTTGSIAAKAENVTDIAGKAATAVGIPGAENATAAAKEAVATVGAAAAKVENVTDTAKEALTTIGAKADAVANVTAPVADANATKVNATPAAEPDLINETLVKFVTDARTFAKAKGKTTALATFANPVGGYVKKDMYIFAYDYDGKALSLPYSPGMVGQILIGQTDSTGLRYVQQMRDTAKKGTGFVKYQEADLMNKGVLSQKVSYVTDVDGSYWIGAGVYQTKEKKPATVVAAVKDVVAPVTNATAAVGNLTADVKTVATKLTA